MGSTQKSHKVVLLCPSRNARSPALRNEEAGLLRLERPNRSNDRS